MGRRVHVDLLVSAAQIAERRDVAHPQTIHTWRRRHADFPDPAVVFDRVLVWHWPDVVRWARRTGRWPS